jgi:hypothetical protein
VETEAGQAPTKSALGAPVAVQCSAVQCSAAPCPGGGSVCGVARDVEDWIDEGSEPHEDVCRHVGLRAAGAVTGTGRTYVVSVEGPGYEGGQDAHKVAEKDRTDEPGDALLSPRPGSRALPARGGEGGQGGAAWAQCIRMGG